MDDSSFIVYAAKHKSNFMCRHATLKVSSEDEVSVNDTCIQHVGLMFFMFHFKWARNCYVYIFVILYPIVEFNEAVRFVKWLKKLTNIISMIKITVSMNLFI